MVYNYSGVYTHMYFQTKMYSCVAMFSLKHTCTIMYIVAAFYMHMYVCTVCMWHFPQYWSNCVLPLFPSPSLPPSLSSLAPPTLTLWVGTASGHTVTYGITVKDMTSSDDGGWSKGGSGGKVTKRKIQLMPTGIIIYNI